MKLALGVLLVFLASRTLGAADSWTSTDSMRSPRANFTLTLLTDGRVLAAAGNDGRDCLADCELYDPARRQWSRTGALSRPRRSHTATLLPDGRVLVVGGFVDGYLKETEIFDPKLEAWSEAGELAEARDSHTATLLPDGRVLIAGGFGPGKPLASVEIFDPRNNVWQSAPSMPTPRAYHVAVRLNDSEILIAAGEGGEHAAEPPLDNLATCSIFRFRENAWFPAASLSVPHAYGESGLLLPGGLVLLMGGEGNSARARYPALPVAEIFHPAEGLWRVVQPMNDARHFHSAVKLADGRVLVAGGWRSNSRAEPLATAELFDPKAKTWHRSASMRHARAGHGAVLLPDGSVLAAGGDDAEGRSLADAEIFTPEGS